ncbi:virulence factor TspB C-terminal domain-related protein (plasmid) [Acinetobacter courvalinii]|uniref:virulence factor TspB C-terminal domain-related protein n=1 Tax=Acinetobacter courvalinii TaxID=280147 RepID=UPI0039C8F99F
MRFFKYLVLIFASIISVDALARIEFSVDSVNWFDSADAACIAAHGKDGWWGATHGNATNLRCEGDGGRVLSGLYDRTVNCPTQGPGSFLVLWLDKGTSHVPVVYCQGTCEYRGNGLTTDTPNYTNTVLQASGENLQCQNKFKDDPPPKCDSKDPYGDCFVPPNDNCMRAKDGSIYCPGNERPPIDDQGCQNGATYCNRPPGGCGSGYVSGSFNGQQICVKSGPSKPTEPNDPNDPNDPNKCSASYCPKPDANKDCPVGYYQTIYNGNSICVKDNPTPNKPNPNDPNNAGGDDGGGASEPSGGDGGSINLKPVIDAINSLKAALLSAIDGVSKKLTTLIDGQKIGNEHLKNIKDESVKTNEKLDKSNGHLEKIEEATKATSEAVGQTNEKLDSLKDSVDSQTKCRDQSTGKYRECTPDDLKKLGDSNATLPTSEIGKQSFSLDLFKVNAARCPADRELNLPMFFGTIHKTVSFQDLCNETAWLGYIVLILAYSFAVVIVLRA